MTLSKIMRDERLPDTVHRFRSLFRYWTAEQMTEMPEAALAHAVAD